MKPLFSLLLVVLVSACTPRPSDPTSSDTPVADQPLSFMKKMEQEALQTPFSGVVTGSGMEADLFPVHSTNVSTEPIVAAARGEPIITTNGKYAGNTIFQDEQNIGLRFMQSLSPDLQAKATLSETKSRHDAQTEAFKDNVVLDYVGLRASDMSAEQQEALLDLANQYISNMRDGHAKIKLEDIRQHLSSTWFAWSGGTDEDDVFYYRIHSPVVLIEFDHQSPIGAPGKRREASRNHIHTVVRTPNGNDYGKDLLRQHLETHPH